MLLRLLNQQAQSKACRHSLRNIATRIVEGFRFDSWAKRGCGEDRSFPYWTLYLGGSPVIAQTLTFSFERFAVLSLSRQGFLRGCKITRRPIGRE